MKKSEIEKLFNLLFLFLLCLGTIIFNVLLKTPFQNIILYIIGSLFYFLYIRINNFDLRYKSDYIQSGEGLIGLFIIILYYNFITENIYILFILTFITLSMIEFFTVKIITPSNNELFLYGLYINFIIIFITWFLFIKKINFDKAIITNTISGIYQSLQLHNVDVATLFMLAIIFISLLFTMNQILLLFSHGYSFFLLSRLDYNKTRFILILTRSLTLSITLLTLGAAGGISNYYNPEAKGRFHQFEVIFITILYTQFIVTLMQVINKNFAILLSFIITYIIYFISNKNMVYIYDRNQ